MELDPSHLMKIEEIVTLLDLSDDCTIAFVRCNEPVLCDAICKEIYERVHSRIYIYNLEMNEESTNLFQLLEETTKSDSYNSKLGENKKVAFFVFGLDSAVKKKNISGKSEALLLLNMMREKFLEIKHPILIWINSASLNLILNEAQDFFSWRTTVFEFDIRREITSSPMFEFGDFDGLDKKRLENLIDFYSNLIKEFNNSGIKDPYKFAYWNYNLGTIKLFLGYSKEAIKYLDTAESITSKLDSKNLKESIYHKLGITYSDLGDTRKAIEYYEQAMKISKEIGDRRGEGNNLGNLGNAYYSLGDTRKAIEYYEQAMKISKEIGDRRGEGNNLGNLGLVYSDLGDTRKAIEYYEQALRIAREISNRRGEGNSLGNLGLVYSDLGDTRKAIEYYEQSLKIAREIGNRRGEGNNLGNLGLVYSDLGDTRKAIEYYEQSLKIAREIGDRRGEGNNLGNLGLAYGHLGNTRKAIEYYEQSLKIAREIGDRRGEGNNLGNLGAAYYSLGDTRKAIKFLKESLAIGKTIEDAWIISFCEQKLKELEGAEN